MTTFIQFFRGLLRLTRPDPTLVYLNQQIAENRRRHLPIRDLEAARRAYTEAGLKAAVGK